MMLRPEEFCGRGPTQAEDRARPFGRVTKSGPRCARFNLDDWIAGSGALRREALWFGPRLKRDLARGAEGSV